MKTTTIQDKGDHLGCSHQGSGLNWSNYTQYFIIKICNSCYTTNSIIIFFFFYLIALGTFVGCCQKCGEARISK